MEQMAVPSRPSRSVWIPPRPLASQAIWRRNRKSWLVAFLQANADVFTWEPLQMPGIPREVIEHHLKIHPDAKPVSQKPRR
jgi:hypothetical protein